MPDDDDKRPKMLTRFSEAKAQEAAALISQFKKWFARTETQEKIVACAIPTRQFLEAYNCTPNQHGGPGDPVPWVRMEGVPLNELQETNDEIRIDLRLSGLRLKTFAEGACRFIGILNEANALPENAYSYADASTNLAEWFLHESLMRAYLKSKALGEDPSKASSYKLDDLLPTYLYSAAPRRDALRAKIVQMVSVGLWHADPPQEGAREWKIRAGFVATTFHTDVFTPVVEYFRPQLRGRGAQPGSPDAESGAASIVA